MAIVPSVIVDGGAEAIAFYERAFGVRCAGGGVDRADDRAYMRRRVTRGFNAPSRGDRTRVAQCSARSEQMTRRTCAPCSCGERNAMNITITYCLT